MENDNTKSKATGNSMEERPPTPYEVDEIHVVEYFAILRKVWWKVALFSLAVGLVTLVVTFQFPDLYQATAIITPPVDEKRPNPALGILASFGIDIGSPSKVEDLETLFRSHDLTARVFRKYGLWAIVLPDQFNATTGEMTVCWTDRLFHGEKGPRAPGDWDAIRVAKDHLKVSVNKRAGTVSVSFESPYAEGSSNIVKYYLDEGKSRLQEEALDRASKNKKFIEEQIGKTVDALTRDRLYSLYSQEVEREMMGRNREQFGFRVIDLPRVPDRKTSPRRGEIVVLALLISFFSAITLFIARGTLARKEVRNKN